tara:strand:- start:3430 stop:4059 length:630 start_codon:yes stop_codon:yes gene_type:complete
MNPAATTSYDIAFWLLDRARAEDSYLQPRALQCLLFLAQAHYAAAYRGRRLMPSVFVIDDAGPYDPNLYRMLENGRPEITQFPIDKAVAVFLDAVWRRYRHDDALRLEQIVSRAGAKEKAVQLRKGAEITTAAMRRMFAPEKAATQRAPAEKRPAPVAEGRKPLLSQPINREKVPEMAADPAGPRVLTSHTGRKVTVTSWTPARAVKPE